MSANSSRVVWKLAVVVLLAAAAGAAFVWGSQPTAKVVAATKGKVANVVTGSVVVEAERVRPITSDVEGRMKGESKLHPGDEVKGGEVVAQLDTADVDLEIEHVQNELKAIRTNIETANKISDARWKTTEEDFAAADRTYNKLKQLSDLAWERAKRDFESAKQLREKEAVDNARALENLQNTLDTLERRKDKMSIRAPFDGVIAEVFYWPNDLVPAKQALATIITSSKVVRAKISEERFANVEVGQRAKVSFLGLGKEPFDATVDKKLPTAEAGTQRYSIFLKVNVPQEKLLPDLTGDVGITVGEHENVVMVPRRALFDENVFVVENGVVRQRHVVFGFIDLNVVEIEKGLQPGELVIVEELEKFRDGQRVRVELLK
jgi:RND family efflux transporter MFP subunit